MNQQRINPNIPLPQGWEAKHDPSTNRYFFINHVEKKTTWQDPRLDPAYQQQYAQQFVHQHPYAPAQPQSWTAPYQPSPARTQPMPTQQAAQVQSAQAAAAAPSKPTCGTCHEKEVPKPGDQCWKCLARDMVGTQVDDEEDDAAVFSPTAFDQSPEPSIRAGVNKVLYKKFHKEYPDVDPEVMQNILFTSSNLEAKVQAKLSAMGYERHRTISFSDEISSGATRPLEQKSSYSMYPQSALKQSQPTQPFSRPSEAISQSQPAVTQPITLPEVKRLSDAEKERVRVKLEQEFGSTTTKAIISMAAESCDFDEEKSRILLKSMNETTPKRAGRSTTTSSTASSVTHSSRTSRDPWSTRTTTSSLSDTSENRPAEASITVPSSDTIGVAATLTASSSDTRNSRRSASPAAVHSGLRQTPSAELPKSPKSGKTQKPTKKIEAKPRTRYQVPAPKQKQTNRQTAKKKEEYISPLRVKPNGPNPQLRKEHDPTLLLQDYLPVHGPDIRNRTGPNLSNVHGPDAANCKGPQAEVKGCVIGSCVY